MKRVEYLDMLKAFAIFSVVLGHALQYLAWPDFWGRKAWMFIYAYHMPLFMFICGLFFKSALKHDFLTMTRRKLVQLGAPTLLAIGVQWLFCCLIPNELAPDHLNMNFTRLMYLLWFLKDLFLYYVILYLFVRLLHSYFAAALVAIVLAPIAWDACWPRSDFISFGSMLPFFCLGMVVGGCRVAG